MNRLALETSPYLLQHAHNPVNWYPWSEEAFATAKKENKPIIVSIGYSTCHWCHVMERESFENEETAEIMNKHFICIKVDREERPDIDQIYMEVVQILSGNGGWPLNCFLLPDGRPFFGGTYYPPSPAYQRPSWQQVMYNISKAYREQPNVVQEQATRLMSYLKKTDNNLVQNNIEGLEKGNTFTPELLQKIYTELQNRFDTQNGGFGSAPKFPATMTIQFLLAYHKQTKNPEALEHALFSLDKMIQGGIYDQIGGGFSRYATDAAWLIPHFEKMLYDNALLINNLSEAYKISKNILYKDTIIETLNWVEREMTSSEGGFYSALDADSEGIEGKFYIWDYQEAKDILQNDFDTFAKYYDITQQGNWEETNILWRPIYNKDTNSFLNHCREKLCTVRAKRIHPSLDDKILLSWNALMCTAYCQAFLAIQEESYQDTALKNIEFLLNKFSLSEKTLAHTYKEGITKYQANLEDYAFIIEALINCYQISFEEKYLQKAKLYTETVIEEFYDEEEGLFFFASEKQTDLIIRQKGLYDSATPSGNSTMAINLQKLAIIFDNQEYHNISDRMLLNIKDSTLRYPSSFAKWASAILNKTNGIAEIAIVGEGAKNKGIVMQSAYLIPYIIMTSEKQTNQYPLLLNKQTNHSLPIYICKEYACQKPVFSLDEAWVYLT